MNVRNRLLRCGVVIGFAAAGLAGTASAAVASNVYVYDGMNYAYSEFSFVSSCDKEEDGNDVYAEYTLPDGSSGQVWDRDGANLTCAHHRAPAYIHQFRVCEDGFWWTSCSDWRLGDRFD